MLGVDAASGTAYGMWLVGGGQGGGPPYAQLLTAMSVGSKKTPPTVLWTCHPPVPSCGGIPQLDTRVGDSPFFMSADSFVMLSSPPSTPAPGVGSWGHANTSAEYRYSPGGTTMVPMATTESLRGRSRFSSLIGKVPNCTLTDLGPIPAVAPGTERAIIYDATFSVPSAVFLTLAPGGMVHVQRTNVMTGANISKGFTMPCLQCNDRFYGAPGAVEDGYAFFATINYTTSVITVFSGKLQAKQAFARVGLKSNAPFLVRESDAAVWPAPSGATKPFPLGFAAVQTHPDDKFSCHNSSSRTTVRLASIAAAGSPITLLRNATVPLCALPKGGCIVGMVGFV
jgi:hypothetical protein